MQECLNNLEESIQEVCNKAEKTGSYPAALLSIICIVPVMAALVSIIIYILFPWPAWSAALGGTLGVVICWFLLAIPYTRFTAVDRANIFYYERLIGRLYQIAAWFAI